MTERDKYTQNTLYELLQESVNKGKRNTHDLKPLCTYEELLVVLVEEFWINWFSEVLLIVLSLFNLTGGQKPIKPNTVVIDRLNTRPVYRLFQKVKNLLKFKAVIAMLLPTRKRYVMACQYTALNFSDLAEILANSPFR